MRILIIQPGIGSYRLDFFNALARRCTLKVLYFYEHASGQVFPEPLSGKLQCECERVDGGWNPRGYYPIRPTLGRKIREFAPDIVIGYEFNTLMLHLVLLKKLSRAKWRLLLWTSDNPTTVARSGWGRRLCQHLGCRGADGILLYSEAVRRCYQRLYHPERTEIVPNIQDEERIRRQVAESSEEARALMTDPRLVGKKIFLFVGRLEWVKNLPLLLRAFKRLNAEESVLVLVGSGSEEAAARALAEQLELGERVIFVGASHGRKLWAWYRVASCLTLTSRFEPYGAVVNEALACGVPCLVSSCAGATDLIRTEQQGVVFESENEDDLVAKMRELLPRLRVGSGEQPLPPSLMPWRYEGFLENFINFCQELADAR